MAKETSDRFRPLREWALGEIISRLLSYAAALMGGLVGIQAFFSSGDLTVALLAAAFVFGMVALGLNQSQALYQARSVKSGLAPGNLVVNNLVDPLDDTLKQLQVGIELRNTTSRAIVYAMESGSCTIDFRIPKNAIFKNVGTFNFPKQTEIFFMPSIEVDNVMANATIEGDIQIQFRFGVDKTPHKLVVNRGFVIDTDASGKATRINWRDAA